MPAFVTPGVQVHVCFDISYTSEMQGRRVQRIKYVEQISFLSRILIPMECGYVGETLLGREFRQSFGGKGANQAVMAAQLGAK